jgi:hypothetical protein
MDQPTFDGAPLRRLFDQYTLQAAPAIFADDVPRRTMVGLVLHNHHPWRKALPERTHRGKPGTTRAMALGCRPPQGRALIFP